MSGDLISLDEASWRLEENNISGAQFAALVCKNEEPLLIGLSPGQLVRDPIDLSRATSLRVMPENKILAGDITWADARLSWLQLVAAFKKRGLTLRMPALRIAPELLRRAAQPAQSQWLLDDPQTPVNLWTWMRPRLDPQPAPRRAPPEWFAEAVYNSFVPASGQPPRGKRGPRSGKRNKAVAAMRQDLSEASLTVDDLKRMPEKELAARYQVSRDTARKARNDVLESIVENRASTNDK
jgi:hypothetical protein